MAKHQERSDLQLIEYAKSAHELLNKEFFDGKLSTPFIDFRNISKVQSLYGVFIKDTSMCYETFSVKEPCAILFSHELLDRIDNSMSLEEQNAWIVSTLLHEMIHQFCHENGIIDVENGLHNKNFGSAADEHGLMCFPTVKDNCIDYYITYLDPDWVIFDELRVDTEICV